MSIDRISNLPDILIIDILSRLPLRYAVRTSRLSTVWRYRWATLPNLIFDEEFYEHFYLHVRGTLEGVIDNVLFLHFGPIHKFELSHRDSVPFLSVDRWITHLSRRSIEELVLEIRDEDCYRIHSSMFSCESLTRLHLSNCILSPPQSFEGFVRLKSLELYFVALPSTTCQKLFSASPALECLILWVTFCPHDLIIDAPKLRFFQSNGNFPSIAFQNTTHIEKVSIISGVWNNSKNFLELLANLPSLRSLALGRHYVKQLCLEGFSGVLPSLFRNLLKISLHVDFNSLQDVSAVLYILQSAPNLREVKIRSLAEKNDEENNTLFWGVVDTNSSFAQLRRVRMTNVVGVQYEEDFISYVLSGSPVLEFMTVDPSLSTNKEKLMKELLSFRRASPQARVVFLGVP